MTSYFCIPVPYNEKDIFFGCQFQKVLQVFPITAFQTLSLTMMATLFLLRDSCPQQQIQWSSELYSPIPLHFSSLISKMSMFSLAISCLTTSNFPQFMDLTFQVPMQYCSLQHQTLLSSSVTFTTECCFCFGFVSSFFLVISPLFSSSTLGTCQPGSSSFSVISFCLFTLTMGFYRQEYYDFLLQWTTVCQNASL